MNEQELRNQVEASDFADELSDEALDRSVTSPYSTGGPNHSMVG